MAQPIKVVSKIRLRQFNPSYHEGLDKDETRDKTDKLCRRIGELQHLLYANQSHSVILVLQGMDTSGKDGASRRVLEYVTPAGVETSDFKVPSHEELAHDYLWRIHKAVPRYGNIGVFNRSHYEDVLVTRVHKLIDRSVWEDRYKRIRQFEEGLAANGTHILKFFLHISKEEQLARFALRLEDPRRNWKISESDYAERALCGDYTAAFEDAIAATTTKAAPWFVIPANHKWFRNLAVSQIIADTMEGLHMAYPEPKVDLADIRRKYHAAERADGGRRAGKKPAKKRR
jgi:PPK2 family polyphosphate:nucleotide phosphotransferase